MIEDFIKDIIPQLREAGALVMNQKGLHIDSDLIKSFEYDVSHGRLVIRANHYWYYVNKGRRIGANKVPITPLIRWMRRYRIRPKSGQTYTQLAFAIQQSIYVNGIKGKQFFSKLTDTYGDVMEEELSKRLEGWIVDRIVNSLRDLK